MTGVGKLMRRVRDERERGAAAMSIIVVVSILLLAFAMLFGLRLSKATDEASGLQTAADAAALAGAQQVISGAPGQIVSAIKNGRGLPCGLGQDNASDFAQRNDATLVEYCYYPADDRVRVTVRSNKVLESGKREERSASAKLGMALGPCSIPAKPTPSTSSSTTTSSPSSSPSSSSSSTTTPPPPPDVDAVITCGDLDIPMVWPGDGGDMIIKFNASLIDDLDLEPALAE